MSRVCLWVAALALAASTAQAQNLLVTSPVRSGSPPLISPAPLSAPAALTSPVPLAFDWTGFYFGGQVGWGDAKSSDARFSGGLRTLEFEADGEVLGGFAGFNFQRGRFVVGVEGDAEFTEMHDWDYTPQFSLLFQGKVEVDWQASLRARAGAVIGGMLVYVTGGAAAADVAVSGGPLGGPIAKISDTRLAWTVGAGVEAAITRRVFARFEYRYTDFGTFEADLSSVLGGTTQSTDLAVHTIRGGVGVLF